MADLGNTFLGKSAVRTIWQGGLLLAASKLLIRGRGAEGVFALFFCAHAIFGNELPSGKECLHGHGCILKIGYPPT